MQHLLENPDTDVSPDKDENWIDGYFINLTARVAYHKKQIIFSRSEIKEPSIDLQSSLKMFLQEAACDADDWTDVNRRYDDRRSFPAFLMKIASSGLDKYASNEDNDISIGYQPNTWSFSEASPDDVDKFLKLMNLPQRIRKESDRRGSLWLKTLLQRVYSESDDDFRLEKARLLDSFLDHLIRIQEEQRFVASSFSVHLQHLRKSALSSNVVVDDGDRHKCPLILSEHTMHYYIWRQKHIFDSLCTMSRESVWLLKTLKDSYFSSPSSIKESNKILDLILVYISKFKKSKEQGVERKYVAETLLGCFVDVVNMNYKGGNPFDKGGNPFECAFSEAAKKTSEMINEAVEKLNSVKCSDLTSGGSPLGCIALGRILFESSLINLRLDLICKNLGEIVKLGVRMHYFLASFNHETIKIIPIVSYMP
ncbi:hypothetical protein MKX03_033541 [Papaver bracteatum]|nr:hypothetical protein MKX03_033541 [Papaver bracteatum]